MTRRCFKCGRPILVKRGKKHSKYREHVKHCTGFDMRVVSPELRRTWLLGDWLLPSRKELDRL